MSKYTIQYDHCDEIFGVSTFKESANTYEEAKQIVEELKDCNVYSNFNIIDNEGMY